MMSWFRRQRLVAALLLLANPALVGSWVAAYHPCPVADGALGRVGAGTVDAIVVSSAEHAGHEGMGMSSAESAEVPLPGTPSHDHSQNDGHCSCIGQCLTAGIALPSLAGDEVRVALEITSHATPNTQYLVALWATTPLDLLPPSTAPPIA